MSVIKCCLLATDGCIGCSSTCHSEASPTSSRAQLGGPDLSLRSSRSSAAAKLRLPNDSQAGVSSTTVTECARELLLMFSSSPSQAKEM